MHQNATPLEMRTHIFRRAGVEVVGREDLKLSSLFVFGPEIIENCQPFGPSVLLNAQKHNE